MAASGGRMGGRSFSSPRSATSISRSSLSSYRRCISTSISSPKSSSENNSTQVRRSASVIKKKVRRPVSSKEAEKVEAADACYIIAILCILCLFAYLLIPLDSVQDTAKSIVIKLQVGLLGMAGSLQKDLNQIAETADTSSPQGLSNILQETTAALLRHRDYCISSYSSVDVKRGAKECEKGFNLLSIEERYKFGEETLVNVDNIRKQTASSSISKGASSEYIVVTIIVAARGMHELPRIKSNGELKKALQKLASISSSNIMAAEVLWTPQKENDSLSEKEMHEDYPLLQPL